MFPPSNRYSYAPCAKLCSQFPMGKSILRFWLELETFPSIFFSLLKPKSLLNLISPTVFHLTMCVRECIIHQSKAKVLCENRFNNTELCVRTNSVVEETNENEFDLFSVSLPLL